MKFAIRMKIGGRWDWVRTPETGRVTTFDTEQLAHSHRRATFGDAGLDEVYVKRIDAQPEVKVGWPDTMPAITLIEPGAPA